MPLGSRYVYSRTQTEKSKGSADYQLVRLGTASSEKHWERIALTFPPSNFHLFEPLKKFTTDEEIKKL